MSKPKVKPVKAWAGVVDVGKGPQLVAELIDDDYGPAFRPELFMARSRAKERYQSVVRVEIRAAATIGPFLSPRPLTLPDLARGLATTDGM